MPAALMRRSPRAMPSNSWGHCATCQQIGTRRADHRDGGPLPRCAENPPSVQFSGCRMASLDWVHWVIWAHRNATRKYYAYTDARPNRCGCPRVRLDPLQGRDEMAHEGRRRTGDARNLRQRPRLQRCACASSRRMACGCTGGARAGYVQVLLDTRTGSPAFPGRLSCR